jgi:hypothetical protein
MAADASGGAVSKNRQMGRISFLWKAFAPSQCNKALRLVTEGFDTPVLQGAKALLDQLA